MPDPSDSGSFVSLQEYMERQIADLRRELEQRDLSLRKEFAARDEGYRELQVSWQRAIDKAEKEMRDKLAVMNEFRGALTDQQVHFVRLEQFDDMRARVESCASKSEVTPMEKRVAALESWQSNMQGRLWGIPMVIGVVVFIITQLMRFLFPKD